MTEGFQAALLVGLGIAAFGAFLALVLLRQEDKAEEAAIDAARQVMPCPPVRASAPAALAAERRAPK
jgi:hypothetical protein